MKKVFKPLITVLVLSIIISLLMPAVSALAATGRINGEGVRVRNKATTQNSTILTSLALGTVVTINSVTNGQEAVSGGGTKWYNITYGGITGYVYGKYLDEITTNNSDSNFETTLLSFPAGYRDALRSIHREYPNWIFTPDNLSISLDSAINLEYSQSSLTSTRKWIELSYGAEWRDERVDINNSSHIKESRWTYASRAAIAFFMDIRNGLTVTNSKSSFPNIFTFLEQSYDSATQTTAGLRTVVAGTFLANGYGGNADAYINDIMAAARESGVSPYVIAGTIRIEQGVNGTSSLISGTYSGYQGYYNFFNYGASGSNVVVNGLKYAKNQGWNSRRASIIGGAKLYASGYISAGQDTYYYMDFNVKFPSKIWHQYATSLYDQCVKAVSMRSVCTANKNAAMTFKIPVYTSMPSSAYRAPTAHTCVGEVKNAKAATCVDSGYSGDTYCKICGKLLSSGSTVPAEGHSYGEWITDVPAGLGIGGLRHRVCTACGNVENEELPPIFSDVPGDVNNDGSLNNRDLTRLYQYLTGWNVTVNRKALDINNDGIVNNKDLSRLLQYLSDWDVVIF